MLLSHSCPGFVTEAWYRSPLLIASPTCTPACNCSTCKISVSVGRNVVGAHSATISARIGYISSLAMRGAFKVYLLHLLTARENSLCSAYSYGGQLIVVQVAVLRPRQCLHLSVSISVSVVSSHAEQFSQTHAPLSLFANKTCIGINKSPRTQQDYDSVSMSEIALHYAVYRRRRLVNASS